MKSLAFAGVLIMLSLSASKSWSQSKTDIEIVAEVFSDIDIDLRPSYEFDKSVKMELINSNTDHTTTSELVYLMRYNASNSHIDMIPLQVDGVKPETDAEVIVDFESDLMLTFMDSDGTKMALVHEIGKNELFAKKSEVAGGLSLEKSGKKKKILGYKCFEYIVKDSDCNGWVWAAPKLDINNSKSLEAIGLEIGNNGDKNGPEGFVLSFELNYNTGETSKMNVLEIKLKDSYQLKTAGYTPTAMTPATDSKN